MTINSAPISSFSSATFLVGGLNDSNKNDQEDRSLTESDLKNLSFDEASLFNSSGSLLAKGFTKEDLISKTLLSGIYILKTQSENHSQTYRVYYP